MGSRDFVRREAKKPKKDAKKVAQIIQLVPPPVSVDVEVVRKKRKKQEEEPET